MISVIITTHDGRKDFCKRAIDSVLKQTYSDYEIIVMDDASTDGTDTMVKENYPDVRYHRLAENSGGPAKPRNIGVTMAEGEYITFLDSDNQYREDHLALLLKAIENVDVAYADRMVYENGEMKGIGVYSDYRLDILAERNFIDTSDFIVRKQLLLDIGGWDERYKRMLDWNLMIRLGKKGCTFNHLPIVLTDYYIHGENLSFKDPVIGWTPTEVEIELPFCGHEIKEPKIAIFTLTYDRREYTEVCFDTLYKTAGMPFDHFIVDNGSTDGTPKYLKKLKNPNGKVHLILNKKNKGIAIASNQALNAMGKDYDIIIKSDNDAYYKSDGWLKVMVDIWRRNRRIALSCYIEGLRDNPGGAPRIMYGELGGQRIGVTKHLGGICHFVDASAYDNYRWNEEAPLHFWSDLDFSNYLLSIGYGMGYLEDWFCEHKDGTAGQEIKYKEYFERRKLERVTSYKRSYQEIQDAESAFSEGTIWGQREIDTIDKYKDYFKGRILEIGCNDGFGTKHIQDLGFEVEGLDISKEKVKRAKARGLKVKQGSMHSLPYEDKSFGTIFCSHTLEHAHSLATAIKEMQRVAHRVVIVVPIEEEGSDNPAHSSPIRNGNDIRKRFRAWKMLHSEYIQDRIGINTREYVFIADDKNPLKS
jgi:glycosyltransferase involved in cell wall biosynthesis